MNMISMSGSMCYFIFEMVDVSGLWLGRVDEGGFKGVFGWVVDGVVVCVGVWLVVDVVCCCMIWYVGVLMMMLWVYLEIF